MSVDSGTIAKLTDECWWRLVIQNCPGYALYTEQLNIYFTTQTEIHIFTEVF